MSSGYLVQPLGVFYYVPLLFKIAIKLETFTGPVLSRYSDYFVYRDYKIVRVNQIKSERSEEY